MTEPKRIVSVSLGSSQRNASAQYEVLDQTFTLERIGTDGSMQKAAELFESLDGKVAAFGLGGTDLNIVAGDRSYSFNDIRKLVQHAKKTPVLDGGGLKHTLEREAVRQLEPVVGWKGRRTLMVSAVDRFGMAEALAQAGADVNYGDLIFGLGVPLSLRSIGALRGFAHALLPILTQLPFQWFYPTGEQQNKIVRDWRVRYYDWAEVIAGDFLYVNRYRPERLDGKTILTNTITPADVEALRAAGLKRLIATTPKIGGRNFATNVMEAFFVAASGKNRPLTAEELTGFLKLLDFKPEVYELQAASPAPVGT